MNKKRIEELTANVGDMALKRRVAYIIEGLELERGDRILDCGCGDGFYLKTISALGPYEIVGFDLNPTSLKTARNYLTEVPLIQGNLYRIPFKENSFNKIFCSEVLEHIPDDLQALKEIYRILKPGGKLLVTVPNHHFPFFWDPINWILEKILRRHIRSGFWAGIWNEHLRLYVQEEIQDKITKAGFNVVATKLITYFCLPFNHIILNGLKRILLMGLLPESIRNSGDKFSVNEKKQSQFVRLTYRLLQFFDRLNDCFPNYKSSVSILVHAVKTE